MEIRISGVVSNSIVDGPGIRYTVFVQGCPHGCRGCHNPQTHDFAAGKTEDTDRLFEAICEDPLLDGVTFSGGEPFCQAKALAELGRKIKAQGLDIICYTGYDFEYLYENREKNSYGDLLEVTDILIDGKFILEKRSLELKFRGSSNQRIIDVKKSLEAGRAVETEI